MANGQIISNSVENPALIRDGAVSGQAQLYLGINPGEVYTKAVNRSSFFKTSAQCIEKTITMQLSNLPEPDTDSDSDWYDVETGNFISTELPAKWMRFKAESAPSDQLVVYVMSVHPTY